MIVGLFTGILLARLLGPEGRGVVGSVVTYATVLVGLGQLSVGDVTVILEKEVGEDQALATAWTVSLSNFLISTPVLAVIIWAVFRTDASVPLMLTVAFFLAFALSNMINQLYLGVFRIRHQFGKVQIFALTKPTVYLAALLVLAGGLVAPTVESILIALTASNLVAVAVRAAIDGLPFVGRLHWRSVGGFLKLALPLYTTKVLQTLGTQGDRLLAVTLLSAHEIGIFLVATTFASVIPGIYSTAVKLLVLPAMVSIGHETRSAQANQMLRLTWAASIVAGLFTAAIAHLLIPLLFGAAYASAGGMAVWLAAANLLRPVRESLLEVQKSYAITRFFALPSMVLFTVFLAVAAALFPFLGVFGIIAGRGVAELVTVAVLSQRLGKYAPEIAIRHWIVPRWRDFLMLITHAWTAVFGGGKRR
jgi:O-antigen/teichoic acid export membrane protein